MALLDRIGRPCLTALAAIAAATATVTLAIPAPVSAQEHPAATDTEPPAFTLRGYLRDRDGEFRRITPPNSEGTKVSDINDRGQIVGLAYPDLDRPTEGSAYLRSRSGRYSVIDPPGDEIRTVPASINDRGDIAGFVVNPDSVVGQPFRGHGFIRDGRGRYTIVDNPDAAPEQTVALAINDQGTVSGDYVDRDGRFHCFFRDRRGRFTTFDHPDADTTPTPLGTGTAYCVINNRGDIAGIYGADGTIHAFMRTRRGGYRDIDMPGAVMTAPSQINNDGQVAGTYTVGRDPLDPNGVSHGFLLDQRGRRDRVTTIDHPRAAAKGTSTYGLNDRGQTVGSYTMPVDATVPPRDPTAIDPMPEQTRR
jgi:hypothetical protein